MTTHNHITKNQQYRFIWDQIDAWLKFKNYGLSDAIIHELTTITVEAAQTALYLHPGEDGPKPGHPRTAPSKTEYCGRHGQVEHRLYKNGYRKNGDPILRWRCVSCSERSRYRRE